ncbi:YlmH family RNA-binding protein [Bacillus sp. SD088]|uniref:YlmH family RNA-binding protein n=1 Tax=Bacillus sp. SD088 TaxID=2782012 RepID=UPI001A95E4C7|nr:RNA-binding protein [Bacillus sp. SD088]MBO0994293.1 RNA-binding protein [Bacillus sp. SD088]
MSDVYQHFRPEEKEFIDQVIAWQEDVDRTYAPKLTDFLDPREQYILRSMAGVQNEIKYQLFGGTDRSERKRALLFPEYYQPTIEDFQIGLYEMNYPKKFVQLDHRMILGSIMSLGIKREKFGDIIIHEDRIQLLSDLAMEDYILVHLQQIGKAKVSIIKQDLAAILSPKEQWKEKETSMSSLRLDTMTAAAFQISRNKAQLVIQQGRTKVNWGIIDQTSFECALGDVISVRGLGRCTLLEILGTTKKDKLRVKLGVLK